MHRLTRIIDRKMARGKQLQAVLLLVLQKLLTPTPAMGVIFGSILTMVLVPAVVTQLGDYSPILSALVVGIIIGALAVLFQRGHDNYWGRHDED